jgi:hypothetical protein
MKSDRSIKQDIEPIKDLKSLHELKPVQYRFKDGSRLQYGFIAQDIEQTGYKHLVYENKGGIKSVAYIQLIAVLTQHIQDLSKRVEYLESLTNRRNL